VINRLPVVKVLRVGRHLFQDSRTGTTNPVGIWKAILKVYTPPFQKFRFAFL
jgi:hypothetical protein